MKPYRLIVCGTRFPRGDAGDAALVLSAHVLGALDMLALLRGLPAELVHGSCEGSPDAVADRWASARDVPRREFPAAWMSEGKRAGPIRNRRMAEYGAAVPPDWDRALCVAFWDGLSLGTWNMIETAKVLGIEVLTLPVAREARR